MVQRKHIRTFVCENACLGTGAGCRKQANVFEGFQQTCNLNKYFIYLPSFYEIILRTVPHNAAKNVERRRRF